MARLLFLVCLSLGLLVANGQTGVENSIAEALEYAPPLPEVLGGRGLKQVGATGAPEITPTVGVPPITTALPAQVLPLEFVPIPEFSRGRGLKQVVTTGPPEVTPTITPTGATAPETFIPIEIAPLPELARATRGLKQVEPNAMTPQATPAVAAPVVAVPEVALPLEFVPIPEFTRGRGLKQVEPTMMTPQVTPAVAAPVVAVPEVELPTEYIPAAELIRTVRGLKQAGDQVIGYPALEAQLVAEVGAPRAETLLPPPKGNGRR